MKSSGSNSGKSWRICSCVVARVLCGIGGGDATLSLRDGDVPTPVGMFLLLDFFGAVAFPEGEGVWWEVAGVTADVADAVGEVFGIADEGVAVSFLPDCAFGVAMGEDAFLCLDDFPMDMQVSHRNQVGLGVICVSGVGLSFGLR